jgi:hypothetical protein
MTGIKSEGKEERKREGKCHLDGGMLRTARVKGICHEFINIYDSRSYIEGVKSLQA